MTFYGNTTFLRNNGRYGGAINADDVEINFQENVTFLKNKGQYGGAINDINAKINFQGKTMFLENEGENGGAIMLSRNVSVVTGQFAEVSFVKNRAQESGGAVYARDSKMVITGQKFSFVENEGYDGGAIALTRGSTIYLEANGSIIFVGNHAYHYGGAIHYVDDYTEDYSELSKCFYGILNAKILVRMPD